MSILNPEQDPNALRELTRAETQMLIRGELPCGHGREARLGPCGGVMQNVSCPHCGLKLNLSEPGSPFFYGQVIWAPSSYTPPKYHPTRTSWYHKVKSWLRSRV